MNGLRTLIIDGALFTLKDMMGALSREMPGGSEFDKAVSIHEAAEKYHSFRPTRILVNYAMAGLRFGQEPFIDVLVQRTNVPIVAYGISRAMEPEAMKAGVSAFVTKPIARDRLPAFYRECADQLQKSARTPAVSRPAAKKSAPPSVRSRAATVGSLTRPDVRPSASAQSRPSRPAALQPHLRTRADRAVEAAQQAIARISGKKGAVPKAEPRRLTPTLQAELSRWPSPEIIVIGSSTGGTEALAEIFRTLKPPLPPIVIAQHIPSMFSRLFAQRLNGTSPLTIREGAQDVALERDHVYISPGGMHTVVRRRGGRLVLVCQPGPKLHGVRPSADVLFASVARCVGKDALGVILTGMGGDGAKGLVRMRRVGAHILGQDEASSVVYGMPKRAMDLGAVEHQVFRLDMAAAIMAAARNNQG